MSPHEKRVFIFETKEQYLEMRKQWKSKKHHSATEHIMHNLLRGYDPERGITALTNQKKIDNGGWYNSALYMAFKGVNYKGYDGPPEYGINWLFREDSWSGNRRHVLFDEFIKKFEPSVNELTARKAYDIYYEPSKFLSEVPND